MTDQTRLDDLLLRYEELSAQEVAVTAEELCKDCPELLEEVKQQIRMLAPMNAILDAAKGEEPECTTSSTNSSRLHSSPRSTEPAVATASGSVCLTFHPPRRF